MYAVDSEICAFTRDQYCQRGYPWSKIFPKGK